MSMRRTLLEGGGSSPLLIPDAVMPLVGKSAVLDDENHRYLLTRTWDKTKSRACFAMLNASTADHEQNDPTIIRCMGFCFRWNFGGLVVVNALSYRTPHPRELLALSYESAVGALNDSYIETAVSTTELTVVAWGNGGTLFDRDRKVLKIVRAHTTPMCLGVTLSGMPLHPLARGKYRVPDDALPRPYAGR